MDDWFLHIIHIKSSMLHSKNKNLKFQVYRRLHTQESFVFLYGFIIHCVLKCFVANRIKKKNTGNQIFLFVHFFFDFVLVFSLLSYTHIFRIKCTQKEKDFLLFFCFSWCFLLFFLLVWMEEMRQCLLLSMSTEQTGHIKFLCVI